ncbi:hypothetical protein GmHk_19G055637 [Glycine max]|nr:hypothetical protein GmHk_19G055637 [Glycine max]
MTPLMLKRAISTTMMIFLMTNQMSHQDRCTCTCEIKARVASCVSSVKRKWWMKNFEGALQRSIRFIKLVMIMGWTQVLYKKVSVGQERLSALCLMQKFVDLDSLCTKL